MSDYFTQLATALDALDLAELAPLRRFVAECGGTLYIAGNGGSCAIALHWACDLQKAAGRRVVALGANASLLTAYGNDHGYDDVFAAELDRLARPGDQLICLSCSGISPNISRVIGAARRLGVPRMLLTGQNSASYPSTQVMRVASGDYAVIEDVFSAIGHWLTKELQ